MSEINKIVIDLIDHYASPDSIIPNAEIQMFGNVVTLIAEDKIVRISVEIFEKR